MIRTRHYRIYHKITFRTTLAKEAKPFELRPISEIMKAKARRTCHPPLQTRKLCLNLIPQLFDVTRELIQVQNFLTS